MTAELVEDLGGRRDRIAGQDERHPAAHARGDEAHGQRGRAVDVAVGPRGRVRGRLDVVLDVEQLGRLAERPAGVEGREVRLHDRGLAGELGLDPPFGDVDRTFVEPREQAEREQVLGPAGVARRRLLDLLDRRDRQRGHRHPVDAELAERAILERILGVARLLEVALGEGVLVDDDRGAAVELAEIRLERGRVHGHEHVRAVARGEDVAGGEVDLEGRDAGQRAGGGADLGREIRQRREVVAEHRRRVGEPAARELHPVAGVSGEANDDALAFLDRLLHVHCLTRHSILTLIAVFLAHRLSSQRIIDRASAGSRPVGAQRSSRGSSRSRFQ